MIDINPILAQKALNQVLLAIIEDRHYDETIWLDRHTRITTGIGFPKVTFKTTQTDRIHYG